MTTKPTAIPRFYGVEFVAEQFGVSKKSVYRWIDAGVLHFHKFQGVLRISEEDLQAFHQGRPQVMSLKYINVYVCQYRDVRS